MIKRDYLKNKILLCGESDRGTFSRLFTIRDVISEGSTSVCYEAFHSKGGKGVLKEYYPKSFCGLVRDNNGQLNTNGDSLSDRSAFLSAQKKYLYAYEELQRKKRMDEYRDLSSFIPEYEIYYGCDENNIITGTVYIWYPHSKLESFDKIIDRIHQAPNIDSEKKLVTVLSAIISLTKCVCALHFAGLVHRDIKPSNFGFVRRTDETQTQTLSLLDLDSVCSVYENDIDPICTEGYTESRVLSGGATNQTDIYSIGATLFNAIIITEETKNALYLYKSAYYNRLGQMVDSSELITASETNSHPKLKSILTKILKTSLCSRANRYNNCEELLEDLENAMFYALPTAIAKKSRSGEKWILTDVDRFAKKNANKDSYLTILYNLFKNPLYQFSEANDHINVLVLGAGNYGQIFLDACLQAGQMRGKELNVSVISDEPDDKDLYLMKRRSLPLFFSIDGSGSDRGDNYGNIRFICQKLETGESAIDSSMLKKQIRSNDPCYVFVALGDDELNLVTAKTIRSILNQEGKQCSVNYVCETRITDASTPKRSEEIIPVYVNADAASFRCYNDVERMALNTHLIWESDLNINIDRIRSNFEHKYNRDSSVSSVLSLKYKLFSVGIDADKIGLEKAAEQFKRILENEQNKALIDELVCIEHRRWVTEKLCLGWSGINDLSRCLTGNTKDEKNKRHICICHSRPKQTLLEYSADNYKKWDSASEEELQKLDELDRVSVELHRLFLKKAKHIKKQYALNKILLSGISVYVKDDMNAYSAFRQWQEQIKMIWNDQKNDLKGYRAAKKRLLDAAAQLSSISRQAVCDQIKLFETAFYPVLACVEHKHWKLNDAELISNIPFILTYRRDTTLMIPFQTGAFYEEFANAAVAAVVNPQRICYLYIAANSSDAAKLVSSYAKVISFLRNRGMNCEVEILCACMSDTLISKSFSDTVEFLDFAGKTTINYLAAVDEKDAVDAIDKQMQIRKKENGMIAFEINESKLSKLFQTSGIADWYSSYRLDSKTMSFCNNNGCSCLGFIRKRQYITASDLYAFQVLRHYDGSCQPDFTDSYLSLWKQFNDNREAWNSLCKQLKGYADMADLLAEFGKCEQAHAIDECRFILPDSCIKSATRIINALKNSGIIEQDSRVLGYTTDSCRVIIFDRYNNRSLFTKLFSNIYSLALQNDLSIVSDEYGVRVLFDGLVFSDVKFKKNDFSAISKLLGVLSESGYINNLSIGKSGEVSFSFASKQIKRLFMRPENILMIYIYHKLKDCALFDDVYCDLASSEFVVTKGFELLFVKCSVSKTEYASEPDRLKWINAKTVLININDSNTGAGANDSLIISCDKHGYTEKALYDIIINND